MAEKCLGVVGARPNFMKIDPVFRTLRATGVETVLVHTGQHYDDTMSRVFFEELGMAAPDVNLNIGSGSHLRQISLALSGLEPVLLEHKPDWVVVVGDVNSTVAGALAGVKLGIPVAHVEAGLRSFDRGMPEEINRIVTDAVSSLLFTPSRDGDENLTREGVPGERIRFVGNVMIDTLRRCRPLAERSTTLKDHGLKPGAYLLATLHRPSTVDDSKTLSGILDAFDSLGDTPIVFPAHPRTEARIREHGLEPRIRGMKHLKLLPPLGYIDFLALEAGAAVVLTDSGGIQEETTHLGVPCLTLRQNTERPVTLREGTNRLVGHDPSKIVSATREILAGSRPSGRTPELWDGHAAERIAAILREA